MERLRVPVRSVRQANDTLRLLLTELERPAADFPFLLRRLAAVVDDMNDSLPRRAQGTPVDLSPANAEATKDDLVVYARLLRRLQLALTEREKGLCEKRSRILAERAALERAGQWIAAQAVDR